MGHVINPVSFRLGTVKIWNSSLFLNYSQIKYSGYFAVVSFNVYFFLSKLFRSRFFTYVTSYIFSHIKLFWKFNKILCFVFLFNGATEIGGYKSNSLVSFFFSKQKKAFKKIKRNLKKINKKTKISIFPSKFFFEAGFSYNFFYKMWVNKRLRYYGAYKPVMIDQIKRDGYKFLFKTKVSPESSTFQRFLFKHMMYKRKELRKKWNKINHKRIKVKKQFRKFFLKKFLKYIYYVTIKKPISIKYTKKVLLATLKYYRNIKLFRVFSVKFGELKLKLLIKRRYTSFFFPNGYLRISKKKKVKRIKKKKIDKKTGEKSIKKIKKKKKVKRIKKNKTNEKLNKKFKCFPRRTPRSFKARNLIFQESIYRHRKKRLKRRNYTLRLHNKFKFFLNKFIKKLKYNIYKIFFKKLLVGFFIINNIYFKYMNLIKSKRSIKYGNIFLLILLVIFLFRKKHKFLILFKKGFNIINKSKFKIDLLFSKITSYNLELGLFKYTSWNVQKKLRKILEFVFKGFKFKMQFHFLSIKNINAKVISYYIAVRLKQKYRIGPILRDVKKFCNSAKEVRGWKLTCAGRFSKKEIASYIVIKGGSFGYSSITSLLDYSFNSVVLKYSICGIKVWFVLRKNFKKVLAFQSSFSKIIIQKMIKEKKKHQKIKFLNELKKINVKSEFKNLKTKFSYFNFKNFHYKRIFVKTSGFWSIWKLFYKNYKFLY